MGNGSLVDFLFLLVTGTFEARCDVFFDEFSSICFNADSGFCDKDSGDGLVLVVER